MWQSEYKICKIDQIKQGGVRKKFLEGMVGWVGVKSAKFQKIPWKKLLKLSSQKAIFVVLVHILTIIFYFARILLRS